MCRQKKSSFLGSPRDVFRRPSAAPEPIAPKFLQTTFPSKYFVLAEFHPPRLSFGGVMPQLFCHGIWQAIKRQWQTGYLPRPPTSPCRSQSLHAGWPPVCSSIFQVLLKSVRWFCRCGWSKIAFPHYFGHWLIQQLVLPYKP